MSRNIDSLKELLEKEDYTCVLSDGENIWTSRERGILPLVQFLRNGEDFFGGMAADRIVGRATAFLYACMGIRELFAQVLSEGALHVLNTYQIKVNYEVLTPEIRNRKGTGICPMEEAVATATTKEEAKKILFNKI